MLVVLEGTPPPNGHGSQTSQRFFFVILLFVRAYGVFVFVVTNANVLIAMMNIISSDQFPESHVERPLTKLTGSFAY